MMHKMMPDIVRGHEIWIEYDMRHMSTEKNFECKLLFGHNMAVDGVADIENVEAAVFNPPDEKSELAVDAGEGCLIIKVEPVIEGHRIITAEYDAGIYTVTDDGWHKGPKNEYTNVKRSGFYYQYAKTIISGYGSKKPNPIIEHELEIIPMDFGHYHAGEKIWLKVLYDGAPLIDSIVTAAVSGNEGDVIEATTDSGGMASIKLDRTGNWMFKVRHADPGKGVEDQYDEKVITAVFTVMGVH